MISVQYSRIPSCLHSGSFYQSLSDDSAEEEIVFPSDCFSAETTVDNYDDFVRMLKVTAFWGLYRVSTHLILYCKNNDPSTWSKYIRDECTDLDFAQDLLLVFDPDHNLRSILPLVRAINTSRIEFVEMLAMEESHSTEPAKKAAENGRLDYLKLLQAHHHAWDEMVCQKAAEVGHLDCLQYLHEQGCPWDETVHTSAAANGHLNCIKYAMSEGLNWPANTGVHLSSADDVEMLKFAIERGGRVDDYALTSAVMKGHTKCLRHLLTFDVPLHDRMVVLACQFGHVSCLELLHQHGAKLTAQAMHNAAVCEQVKCVQFLHEHGCAWGLVVTQVAANRGNVEMLRYAIDHGCPYDKCRVVENALLTVSDGAVECLQYLIEERKIPFQTDGAEFMAALTNGNYKAIQYLMEKGCSYKKCAQELCDTWFQTLSDHYDQSHKNEDENLLKCIEYAVSQEWDIVVYGAGWIRYVRFSGSRFSLCRDFLRNQGHC